MLKEKHFLSCLVTLILIVCSAARIRAKNNSGCVPSSCGDLSISYPFRLRSDPPNCGHPDAIFVLECKQNRAVLKTKSRRYNVQEISYSNFSARISDPGLDSHNYSSCPIYSSSDNELYSSYISVNYDNHVDIAFLNCLNPADNPFYVESPFCGNRSTFSNSSRVHSYSAVGRILISELEESCTYDAMTEASLSSPLKGSNYTYSEIHDMMAYGIEFSWHRVLCTACEESSGTCILENNKIRCRHYCYEDTPLSDRSIFCKLDYYLPYITIGVLAIGGIMGLRFLFGIPFLIGLVWHKYKREDSSADSSEAIEELLRHQTDLMPINYSYKEIKRMTSNFKVKLGEGISGTVFKGKLNSGPPVAVKMMANSSVSDKDFIGNISVMAKINHPNVVKLIGFCIQGSRRALVHEFVQCGSLDKHILLQEGMASSLTRGQMFRICLGIAHGMRCLHGVQVSHLGIKPQNILLDEDFNPKISDSGLHSFYSRRVKRKRKMGFIAPELFYKNIGEVSCKADVYSFGMLVLEMEAMPQSLNPYGNKLGKTYFPWRIFKQLSEGEDVEIRDADVEEKTLPMMMMKRMVFVGLKCIQIRPEDRPSMNEVVGLLEEQIDTLQMPPNPFQTAMVNQM